MAENSRRLLIAIVIVTASMPLVFILALLASPTITRLLNPSISPTAMFTILFVLFWAGFMFFFTLVGRLMAFSIALSIPAALAVSGLSISTTQWAIILISVVIFILLARLINRTATSLLAIFTVLLAYGLYLFPLLTPVFADRSTAVVAWIVNILLCWMLLSVGMGLIENAIIARRKPDVIRT